MRSDVSRVEKKLCTTSGSDPNDTHQLWDELLRRLQLNSCSLVVPDFMSTTFRLLSSVDTVRSMQGLGFIHAFIRFKTQQQQVPPPSVLPSSCVPAGVSCSGAQQAAACECVAPFLMNTTRVECKAAFCL